MRAASQPNELLKAFITEVRQIAAERELEFDHVYEFGTREFYDGTYDMGHMKLTGNGPNDFVVWWYPEPFDTWNTHIRLDVIRDGDDWEVEMRTTIIKEPGGPWNEEGTSYDYAYFNTATEESRQAYRFDSADGTTPGLNYTLSRPNQDGSITFVSKERFYSDWSDSMVTEERVGWGDDTQGGVIATGEEGESSYAAKEFYDQNGGLVQQSWGEKTLDTSWLSWIDESAAESKNLADSSVLGLSAAADTVYVFRTWDTDGNPQSYLSTESDFSGDVDGPIGSDVWDVYYKSGTEWGADDAVYNWDAGEEATLNVDGTDESGWLTTYSIGYQVPAPEQIFGGEYYLRNQFPFKQLLPLQGAYEGKTVRRKEGETYTDSSGDETWTWTDYEYFIDDNDNAQLDEGNDATDLRLNNVWMSTSYTWNPDTDEETVVKAPFFSTTGTNLPSYFSVPDQSFIGEVEQKIDNAYSDALADLSLNDVPTEDISDSPQFDDLRN